MTLTQIASKIPGARLEGGDAAVSAVRYDSRKVCPGELFVAMPGIPVGGHTPADGHAFVREVVAKGAAAVAVEESQAAEFSDLPVPRLIVPDTRAALGEISCAFYGDPSHALCMAGVTGTNGKTTTALLIDAIARAAGDVTGVIGTIGVTIAGESFGTPGDKTTPEAPDLQELLAKVVSVGGKSAAMEVASNALTYGRTSGIAFDVGIFTNLTQDHLDLHGTMDAYRNAKGILFTAYPEVSRASGKKFTAVLNTDDEAGRFYAEKTTADRILTYSPSGIKADIVPVNLTLAVDSLSFVAKTPAGDIPVNLAFGGTFQVANALAAVGYGLARGLSPEVIAAGLAACKPVPGRFEPVVAGQEFAVLVDYAHTPDGIENVLKSARPLTSGKLIVVFGCGGDRDNAKRPMMGRLAELFADVAIVTSDNPRTEDPEKIVDMVLKGMEGERGTDVRKEVDRRKAISLAVNMAKPGDTVVIAGKGHEGYQILGAEKTPFSDVEVAAEEIRRG